MKIGIFRITTQKSFELFRAGTTLPQPGSFTIIASPHATGFSYHKDGYVGSLIKQLLSSICHLDPQQLGFVPDQLAFQRVPGEFENFSFSPSHHTELGLLSLPKRFLQNVACGPWRPFGPLTSCGCRFPKRNDTEKLTRCTSCQVFALFCGTVRRTLVGELTKQKDSKKQSLMNF